ncbi:haloacid dehalogenase type II [Planosporangium flavigriseum]|uniref:Dehalogenase n=1 Tax=Planosporangium flavigriseum TaxID=373681 RepID=A0A8J3PNI3_9ACTN|nr:haloacid dehalogenase type II [Planosporangium flavigriseum]NJC66973.1 haloacid dehalogenase type II [Planosporangium flavigriseum]GIG73961.1 dehalogenase [Planosporangium flavigriseum]
MSRIDGVVFDVNETLFSLDRLREAFADVDLDPGLVPLWFAGVLRDGFALTVLDCFTPFTAVAADNLRALDARVDNRAVATVLAAFRELTPHDDVEPALYRLHEAGIPAATLSNGSAEGVQALLDRAGLTRYVSRNLSIDAVRRWKPAPEPYRYAATELGVEPQRLALVAVHPWDCAGAAAAGLTAGWVRRSQPHWPAMFPTPAVTGADLTAVVAALLAD